MAGRLLETDVEELAKFLKTRKNQGQHVGLFLGSRTGTLYDGKLYEALSETLKNHLQDALDFLKLLRLDTSIARELSKWAENIRHFASLTAPADRFKESYSFLDEHFNENSIHSIFFNALGSDRPRIEDELLAGLIKSELFNIILTTNFDTSLEDACALLGMKKPEDYDLLICGADDDISTIGQSDSRYGQIVKIFGDFTSLKYTTVGHKFNLDGDPLLKRLLMATLAKDIIILGYDPNWDKPIEEAFQETGGMLWYVNEERPQPGTHLDHVLKHGYSKFIGGPDWSYISFLQSLSDLIGGKVSPSPAPSASDPARKKAFISYSHNDKKHLDRLKIHLKGFPHIENFNALCDDVWDDTKIHLGANWQEEIENALSQAKVAVCLVSADFFGSDFIREKELPLLYEAAEAHKLEIWSVILGTSSFKHQKLADYQAINPASEPLEGMEPYKQDMVWDKLAEKISENLRA